MFLTFGMLVLGFVFLVKGADLLVDGASSIAKKYGISNLVIGLTIVSFGTSAPELAVSSLAALKGSGAVALGNVIGSNICNILLILGVSAIVGPIIVRKSTVKNEIPLSFLAALAVLLLANDRLFGSLPADLLIRSDGLILLLFFAIFIFYTFAISSDTGGGSNQDEIKKRNFFFSSAMVIAGLVALFFGGRWIVSSASEIARFFGLSEALIGLTIVAVGTSLPELAASAMAVYRKNADMAVGNVIGSNIFNLFFILGASATISPIAYDVSFNLDGIILALITAILMILIFVGRRNYLGKWEGTIMLAFYAAYLAFLIYRG